MNGNKASILGVAVNSTSKEELLKTIIDCASGNVIAIPPKAGEAISSMIRQNNRGIASSQAPRNDSIVVWTPNPEFVVEAQSDHEFRELLNKSDINLPDGIGLVWASKILRNCMDSRRSLSRLKHRGGNDSESGVIKERVSGADMVERLLEVLNERWPAFAEASAGKTVGVAGARRGERDEANILVKRLTEKYPNIKFVNLDNNKPLSFRPSEARGGIPSNQERRDPSTTLGMTIDCFNIVFACHGMKKQEQWIMENKDRLNASVFMGVGGSLDFLTGFSKRAPKIMRVVGMEWLWRGLQKPRHFLRIWKAVFVFGFMIVKEMLKKIFLYKRVV